MRPIAFVPLALIVLASPVPSSAHSHPAAHSYAYGYEHRGHGEDGDFGWAIVSDGHSRTMSDLDDNGLLDELKDRYGDDFLYVRDGKDRYVIRDSRLVERAERSSDEIRKYGKEIGQLARAQAKLALSHVEFFGQRRSLERAQRELEREIARSERRGEPTEGLERALRHIRNEIESLPDEDHEASGMTPKEREDLERQSDQARDRLQSAVTKMRQDIRDILREAKERGKAEKLDSKEWDSF